MEVSRAKKNLMCVITCIFWFCQYSFVPYMSENLTALGATSFFIGLVAGGYGLVQLVMRIPLGIVADITKKHKIFVIAGMFFNFIAPLLMAISDNPVYFLILRGLSGLGASTWVSYTVLYSSYFHESELNKSIGNINTSNNMGRFFAFAIGAFAAQSLGIKAPFYVSAAVGFVGFILTFFVFETKIDVEPIKISQLIKVMYNKQLIIASVLCALSQFVTFATAMSFVSSFAKEIGASDLDLGLLTASFVLPMVLGSYLSGKKSVLKLGMKMLLSAGFAMLAVYCIIIPMCSSVIFMYPAQLLGGFGNGIVFSLLMAYSIGDIDQQKKSTAMGVFQSLYSLGMTFGPTVMGALLGTAVGTLNYSLGFSVIAAVAIMALVIVLLLVKKRTV